MTATTATSCCFLGSYVVAPDRKSCRNPILQWTDLESDRWLMCMWLDSQLPRLRSYLEKREQCDEKKNQHGSIAAASWLFSRRKYRIVFISPSLSCVFISCRHSALEYCILWKKKNRNFRSFSPDLRKEDHSNEKEQKYPMAVSF